MRTSNPTSSGWPRRWGNGYPIGACLVSAKTAAHMTRGSHGTTFGGNPVACAAALATLEVIEQDDLLQSAAKQIDIVRELAKAKPIAAVKEVRGCGAMIGIQVGEREAAIAGAIGKEMMARGVLVTVPGGHTIPLLLPYFADAELIGEVWDTLAAAVIACEG